MREIKSYRDLEVWTAPPRSSLAAQAFAVAFCCPARSCVFRARSGGRAHRRAC